MQSAALDGLLFAVRDKKIRTTNRRTAVQHAPPIMRNARCALQAAGRAFYFTFAA